jgi:transposase-like protein
VRRGRPELRSVDDRKEAVVELLSGKATVDQVAFRFGVDPEKVEKWREVALEGIEQSTRQGSGKSKGERELERKPKALKRAFTDLATTGGSSTRWPCGRLLAGNAVAERFIQRLKVELTWTRDWEMI